MEITTRGPDVEIKLNGATILHDRLDMHPPALAAAHPGLKRTHGLIGLQSHNDRVEFRDIRVKDPAQKATE